MWSSLICATDKCSTQPQIIRKQKRMSHSLKIKIAIVRLQTIVRCETQTVSNRPLRSSSWTLNLFDYLTHNIFPAEISETFGYISGVSFSQDWAKFSDVIIKEKIYRILFYAFLYKKISVSMSRVPTRARDCENLALLKKISLEKNIGTGISRSPKIFYFNARFSLKRNKF